MALTPEEIEERLKKARESVTTDLGATQDVLERSGEALTTASDIAVIKRQERLSGAGGLIGQELPSPPPTSMETH